MIDLRSDTVTQPTAAMLEAMQRATYDDDSRDGDPTVQKLEALGAERTGKAAGLYVPSGTMSNLVALLAYADRGGEVLVEQGSHILHAELGNVSTIAGMFYGALSGNRGAMDVDALRERIRSKISRNKLGTTLVWME